MEVSALVHELRQQQQQKVTKQSQPDNPTNNERQNDQGRRGQGSMSPSYKDYILMDAWSFLGFKHNMDNCCISQSVQVLVSARKVY